MAQDPCDNGNQTTQKAEEPHQQELIHRAKDSDESQLGGRILRIECTGEKNSVCDLAIKEDGQCQKRKGRREGQPRHHPVRGKPLQEIRDPAERQHGSEHPRQKKETEPQLGECVQLAPELRIK